MQRSEEAPSIDFIQMLALGAFLVLYTDSLDEGHISSMLFTFCGGADGDVESVDDLVMMLSVPLECRLAGVITFPADSPVSQLSK